MNDMKIMGKKIMRWSTRTKRRQSDAMHMPHLPPLSHLAQYRSSSLVSSSFSLLVVSDADVSSTLSSSSSAKANVEQCYRRKRRRSDATSTQMPHLPPFSLHHWCSDRYRQGRPSHRSRPLPLLKLSFLSIIFVIHAHAVMYCIFRR